MIARLIGAQQVYLVKVDGIERVERLAS
jgi:hypothetical protein